MFFSASVSGLSVSAVGGRTRRRRARDVTRAIGPRAVGVKVSMFLPARPKRGMAIFSRMCTGLRTGFITLFLIVFAILFSDTSVKDNCVGGVNKRMEDQEGLVFSGTSILFICAAIAVLLCFVVRVVTRRVCFKCLR